MKSGLRMVLIGFSLGPAIVMAQVFDAQHGSRGHGRHLW